MRKPLVGCLLLWVAACAHPKPPGLQTFSLATYKASYRDARAPKTSVCSEDPATLVKELEAMNAVLEAFLQATSAPVEGIWSDEHVALLGDGQKQLPPALDAYEAELHQASSCKKVNAAETVKKGLEYVRQAKARLTEAQTTIAAVQHRQAVKKWHDGLNAEEQSAQAQWCPPKPKPGSVDIYFALQDEKGHWEWHFCDGVRVQAEGSGPGEFIPPIGDKKKRKPKPYLDAALKYPTSEVHHAPAPPKVAEAEPEKEKETAAPDNAAPAPAEKDKPAAEKEKQAAEKGEAEPEAPPPEP